MTEWPKGYSRFQVLVSLFFFFLISLKDVQDAPMSIMVMTLKCTDIYGFHRTCFPIESKVHEKNHTKNIQSMN